MEAHMNFEYLCRVCAANTKGRNSVAECVYILKTNGLKDKIYKYLSITVSETDLLPKVLCKTCFRQVEQTASLSSIGKHTQEVFEEFVRHSKPRKPTQPAPTAAVRNENQNEVEFTPITLGAKTTEKQNFNTDAIKALIDLSVEPKKTNTATATSIMPPSKPASVPIEQPVAPALPVPTAVPKHSAPEEVVVHVSVNEPFTQQTQRKMISASKRRESIPPDMRFTPKSIAQRPLAPKQPEISLIPTPTKKTSPAGVLNFLHNPNNNLTQSQTSKITISPFALERVPSATSITPNIVKDNGSQNNNSAAASSKPEPTAGLPKPTVGGAQKRKSTKPLSVLRTNGQVSLLKKSQKPMPEEMPVPMPMPMPMPVPMPLPLPLPLPAPKVSPSAAPPPLSKSAPASPPSIATKLELLAEAEAEELPDKIIIASAKNQKHKQKQLKPMKAGIPPPTQKSKVTAKPKPMPPRLLPKEQQQQQQQPQLSAAANSMSMLAPAVPSDILLGKVIRDADLLKLILKALKWPVDSNNMEQQMNRLRNSKFSAVMSDSNLLQDTDLTQLLGPYLAPVLLAAHVMQQQQQQQQQQQMAAAASAANASTNNPPVPIIPYKLPPETSVQLVPASPTDESNSTSKKSTPSPPPLIPMPMPKREFSGVSNKSIAHRKRTKLTTKQRNANVSISLLKQSELLAAAAAAVSARQNFPPTSNMDVTLVNKSLDSLPFTIASPKEKSTLKRKQRPRKHYRSTPVIPPDDIDFDLDDDIVLMEPDEPIGAVPDVQTAPPAHVTSIIEPLPIGDGIENNKKPTPSVSSDASFGAIPLPTSRPLITRPIIKRRRTVIQRANVATTPKPNTATTATVEDSTEVQPTVNTKEVEQVAEKETSAATTTTDANAVENKNATSDGQSATASKPNSARKPTKSALGKQLLEAIGLKKLPTAGASESGETQADTTTELLSARESVQQIRAALKRSLKQAQEQRKHNKVDTIKQDADSTTKTTTTTKTDDSNEVELVDVEDQIAKNVVQREEKQSGVTQTPETKVKTETPRSNSQRRGRQRKEVSYVEIDEHDMKTIQQLKDEVKSEKKSEIVSSTAAGGNKVDSTPRRRGRKRKDDNQDQPAEEEVKIETELTDENIKLEVVEEVDSKPKEQMRDSSATRPKRIPKSNPKFAKSPLKQEIPARRSILTRSRNRN